MAHVAPRSSRLQQQPYSTRSETFGNTDFSRGHGLQRDEQPTIAYITRILCARNAGPSITANGDASTETLASLLPPLTSSNAIDIQLYALIAVVLENFVQTWYNRITPDQQFVSEIVRIIAHCTRGVEHRLRHVALEDVLLDEIPGLLIEHIDAVEVSQRTWQGKEVSVEDRRTRFLTLRPHVALDPVPLDEASLRAQQENEASWSLLLVNRILPLLLPPEDLRNPCLDVLVSEIFADMIMLHGLCGKASEPWLIWDGISKLLYVLRPETQRPLPRLPSQTNRLEQFGLLATARGAEEDRQHSKVGRFDAIVHTFWSTLQAIITTGLLLRALTVALMQASAFPQRAKAATGQGTVGPSRANTDGTADASSEVNIVHSDGQKQPIVCMQIWTCLSRLVSLERRMPWLSGTLSLLQWLSIFGLGEVCCLDSRLDRLMASAVREKVRHPHWLPPALAAIRSAVFPGNVMAPGRPTPTAEEVVEMRDECARAIVEAMPDVVRTRFFATSDKDLMRDDVKASLDLFADAYINKHLIVAAVELLVVRIFPELLEHDGDKR